MPEWGDTVSPCRRVVPSAHLEHPMTFPRPTITTDDSTPARHVTTSFSRIRLPRVDPRVGATLAAALLLAVGVACGSDDPTEPVQTANCPAASGAAAGNTLSVLGCGNFKPSRTSAEIFVRGTTAYTTTWGNGASAGSVFYIWDVAGNAPQLVDSVKVEGSRTLGDIAVSDDGG